MVAGSARRARFTILAVVLSLGASLLLGVGTVLAAKQPKVSVCHYDRTLDTWVMLSVAEPSKHLAHGDTLADGRLVGKTVHALAYSDIDGVAGYAACGDILIAALVEASGDGVPSAGDKVLLGRYPTAFDAPFASAAFAMTEVTAAAATSCDSGGVLVNLGVDNDAVWGTGAGGAFGIGDLDDPDLAHTIVLLDNIGGGSAVEFTDFIVVNGAYTTQGHNGDNPWLVVEVSGVCNS